MPGQRLSTNVDIISEKDLADGICTLPTEMVQYLATFVTPEKLLWIKDQYFLRHYINSNRLLEINVLDKGSFHLQIVGSILKYGKSMRFQIECRKALGGDVLRPRDDTDVPAVIECHNLHKRYNIESRAINGTSLKIVARGRTVVLHNGSQFDTDVQECDHFLRIADSFSVKHCFSGGKLRREWWCEATMRKATFAINPNFLSLLRKYIPDVEPHKVVVAYNSSDFAIICHLLACDDPLDCRLAFLHHRPSDSEISTIVAVFSGRTVAAFWYLGAQPNHHFQFRVKGASYFLRMTSDSVDKWGL